MLSLIKYTKRYIIYTYYILTRKELQVFWCGRGVYNMEKEILQKISRKMKWKGKLIIKLFPKTTLKIYHIGRIDGINYML